MSKHHRKQRKGVLYIEGVLDTLIQDVVEAIHDLFPAKPHPVSNLSVVFLGSNEMSKIAKVQLAWTPSVSPDVAKQVLTVVVGSAEPVVIELAASVSTTGTFDVPEETAVHVELVAVDAAGASDKAVLDFVIGDLTVPVAPTGLSYSIVSIVDAEVPAPVVEEVVVATPAEEVAAPADAAQAAS